MFDRGTFMPRAPRTEANGSPHVIPSTRAYQERLEQLYTGKITYNDFINEARGGAGQPRGDAHSIERNE